MKKRGKRYNEALAKVEKSKLYTNEEAVKLAKERIIEIPDKILIPKKQTNN